MNESTFYGLNNQLSVLAFKKAKSNLFTLECIDANQESVFLYLHFLSAEIVRIHYKKSQDFDLLSPNKHLEFNNFDFEHEDFVLDFDDQKEIKIVTSALIVKIRKDRLALSIEDHEANILSEDVPGLGYWSKDDIRCYKRLSDPANPPIIYGLGDKTGAINRWGKRFRSEPVDALGYDSESSDPLYKDIPFFVHLDPKTQAAHGIFFDNYADKFFDFGKERKPDPYYYFGAKAGELNYYFIKGPKINDVLKRYLELTGMPKLMPKFSFGYLASGMSYAEDKNASVRVEEFLQAAQKRNITVSAFHLSSGYLLNEQNKRWQFIWSEDRFEDPASFFARSKNEHNGLEFTANVKPVLLCDHPDYDEAAQQGFFVSQDAKAQVVDYWGGPGSYIDFTNEKAQVWWKRKLKEKILAKNVRGIWNDNNEYEIVELENKREQILVMSKLAYEASVEFEQMRRPWILTRSAYSGVQKYAQTWTGDNASSFHSLKYDIAILSSMSLSGLFHVGADIGGFWGESPDSELLTRWVQCGVFSPRFCIHSYKEQPTEAWMHEKNHLESFEIIKNYMNLRDKLLPYISQANAKASFGAEPIQRMTVMDFQDDVGSYEQSFEYLFGEAILVAPIYEQGARKRELYLPGHNQEWISWWDYKSHHGGSQISVDAPLEEIPLFVKANSIVPLEHAADRLELKIFLAEDFLSGDNQFEYKFYEDDGDSFGYLNGESLMTAFRLSSKNGELSLEISKQEGSYQSPYQNVLVTVVNSAKTKSIETSIDKLKAGLKLI